jgi:hypothetical protein
MFVYDNLYIHSCNLFLFNWNYKQQKPFSLLDGHSGLQLYTGRGNVNKNIEKAKNMLFIISQRQAYFKSNQAPPCTWIFLLATVMESIVYFAAGLWFNLYLLANGQRDLTSLYNYHVWQLTKTAVSSLKKNSLMNKKHSILEYNPIYIYIILYVACVIRHTFIWLLQTNTWTQNKYRAYSDIRLTPLHNLQFSGKYL